MAGDYKSYDDLLHTRQLSNRSYAKAYSFTDFPDGGVIYSEGAWKIRIYLTSPRVPGADPLVNLQLGDGDTFQLLSAQFGQNVIIDGAFLFELGGNPNTVRDDEIKFTWTEDIDDQYTLWVIFDRIVWKKDDNYYPAVAANRQDLNEMNGKGNPEE